MGYNLINDQPVLQWHWSMVWLMLLWGIRTLNLSDDIITCYQQWKSTPAITTHAAACHCDLNFYLCITSGNGAKQQQQSALIPQRWHLLCFCIYFGRLIVFFWITCQKDICCCTATATQNISLCDEGCHIVVIILEAAQNNNNNQQGNQPGSNVSGDFSQQQDVLCCSAMKKLVFLNETTSSIFEYVIVWLSYHLWQQSWIWLLVMPKEFPKSSKKSDHKSLANNTRSLIPKAGIGYSWASWGQWKDIQKTNQ